MPARTRFYGRSRVNESIVAGLIAIATAGAIAGTSAVMHSEIPWLVALSGLITSAILPTRIDVGNDGIRIAWIGARFISFRGVDTARAKGRDAVLVLKNGAQVRLPVSPKNAPLRGGYERRAELVKRVREALEAYERAAPGIRQLEASLFRRVRSAPVTMPIYRLGGDFDEDNLWRLVEAPTASMRARLQAAFLLLRTLDEPGRRRIRGAAHESASPSARAALRTVASRRPPDHVGQMRLLHCTSSDCTEE
jgi:hypothetical protein